MGREIWIIILFQDVFVVCQDPIWQFRLLALSCVFPRCKLSRYSSLLGTRATENQERHAKREAGARPPCARWPCCAHSAAPARRSSAGWEGSTKPGGHARRLCDVNTCFGLDAAAHSPPVAKDEGQQPGAKGHALGASSSSASAEEAASACCTIHDCGRAGGDCFGHAQAG